MPAVAVGMDRTAADRSLQASVVMRCVHNSAHCPELAAGIQAELDAGHSQVVTVFRYSCRTHFVLVAETVEHWYPGNMQVSWLVDNSADHNSDAEKPMKAGEEFGTTELEYSWWHKAE